MTYKVGRCLLRELLKEKHIEPIQLAERTGIPFKRISDYMNQHRPSMSLSTAKTIAACLGCYIDDLYEWDPLDRGR